MQLLINRRKERAPSVCIGLKNEGRGGTMYYCMEANALYNMSATFLVEDNAESPIIGDR